MANKSNATLRAAIIGVLLALPPTLVSASKWIEAKAESEKAWSQYGEYVTDQLYRDEALDKARRQWEDCMKERARERPIAGAAMFREYTQAKTKHTITDPTVALDALAKEQGWKPSP